MKEYNIMYYIIIIIIKTHSYKDTYKPSMNTYIVTQTKQNYTNYNI